MFPICVDWVMERNFEEALIKSREEQQRTYEERGAAHSKTQLKGNGIKLKMEIFLLLKHHRRRWNSVSKLGGAVLRVLPRAVHRSYHSFLSFHPFLHHLFPFTSSLFFLRCSLLSLRFLAFHFSHLSTQSSFTPSYPALTFAASRIFQTLSFNTWQPRPLLLFHSSDCLRSLGYCLPVWVATVIFLTPMELRMGPHNRSQCSKVTPIANPSGVANPWRPVHISQHHPSPLPSLEALSCMRTPLELKPSMFNRSTPRTIYAPKHLTIPLLPETTATHLARLAAL